MFKRLKKFLFIAALAATCYLVYIAPVLLQYSGGGCLVGVTRDGYHTDWLWGAGSIIKRKYTVLCGIAPPVQLAGNQHYHNGLHELNYPKPVPLPGEWQFSQTRVNTRFWAVNLYYVAYTNRSMYHTRIGWRWDDLEDYFTFTLVPIKKIQYNWERIMWVWEKKAWERNLC